MMTKTKKAERRSELQMYAIMMIFLVGLGIWDYLYGTTEIIEDKDAELYDTAYKINPQEANSCAEMQWEDYDYSRNCLMDLIKENE